MPSHKDVKSHINTHALHIPDLLNLVKPFSTREGVKASLWLEAKGKGSS